MFQLLLLTASVGVSDPPRYVPDPPKLEQRVSDLEQRVAQLEKQLNPVVKPQPIVSNSVVVPAGSHAHTTIDGKVIIHGNENLGNAAAHQGIAYPWIRTAEAGQVVQQSSTVTQKYMQSNCPMVTALRLVAVISNNKDGNRLTDSFVGNSF